MGQGPIVTFPVLPMHRTPSPRVRGEGGVRGRPRQSQSCGKAQNCGSAPSPSLASLARPLPARGRGEKAISFSRCGLHPSYRHATRISPLSAPTFAREHRRWSPVPSRSALQATNVRRKKARKRNADRRVANLRTFRVRRAQSAARSPLGVPPRLLPEGHSSQGSASGQASWDVVSPGVTRCLPVPVQRSTPRAGRNAGEHDAQGRPGVAVTSRHARAPPPAPSCGVTAQRPCTRAR